MTAILSHFASLFSYGLGLDERLAKGAQVKSSAEVNAELLVRVKSCQQLALEASKRSADVEEASFAVVAWLDETLATHYEWWGQVTPLQDTLFHTRNAGNEFFHHLEQLSLDQDEVREVYYVALCLGFKGMFYFEEGDTGKLAGLKDLHSRNLPIKPAVLGDIIQGKITPQPYNLPDPKGPRMPGVWPERLARMGAAAAAAIVIGVFGYYYWTTRSAGPGPERPTTATLDQVNQIVTGKGCRDIEAKADALGALAVRGHAQTAETRQRLTEELRKLPGGANINVSLEVLASPFCEVVGVVQSYRQRNLSEGKGFSVGLRDQRQPLVEGDPIVIEATMPDEAACLYVDYFSADGSSVVHVHPSGGKFSTCEKARQKVIIGGKQDGRYPWQVSAPYGQEMVLAIVSPQQLFDPNRDETEAPQEYLKALEAALQKRAPNALAAYSLLVTAPAPKQDK